jgi:hypothetical protein
VNALLTISISANAILLVLWLIARNDNRHERAASVEMSRQFLSRNPARTKALLEAAAYACDVFDQADTGHAIEDLGDRGRIARDAIEDLKQIIIDQGGEVILPPPTEQYRQFPRRFVN